MRQTAGLLSAGTTAGILLLLLTLAACDRGAGPNPGTPSRKPRNVLLITIDAARADRLGCYGHATARTPALDKLAQSGALFERAYCQAPLVLPSHAALLTGRYPRELGLRDDGRAALAETPGTLATIARRAGLETAAFVSTVRLNQRFGLSRGFDLYDDQIVRASLEVDPADVERSAAVVTDQALAWLKSHGGTSGFFCWVNYHDPHEPHEPPPDFRADAQTPYDGELTFVDSQIQRLQAWLVEAGKAEDTLLWVVGAYGQSLGEHGENGHALLLHESNVRVPCILAFPGVIPGGRRIGGAIELASLMPTVCALLGWEPPAELAAPTLVGALLGSGDAPPFACYVESAHPFTAHRWAEQRALLEGAWKYVSSTRPELYDLVQDAGEHSNVLSQHADIARTMEEKLRARYVAMTPGRAAAPRAATSQPTSGPVPAPGAGGDEFLTVGAPDPKDMLPLLDQFRRVPRMLRERKFSDAVAQLEKIVAASPGSPSFQRALGAACIDAGDLDRAIAALAHAARIDPVDPQILATMGDALVLKGDRMKAADLFTTALAINDADVDTHVRLARVAHLLQYSDAAVEEYKTALNLYPRHIDAAMELIALLQQFGRAAEIIPFFQRRVAESPRDPGAVYGLGVALAASEKYDEAAVQFRAVLTLDPEFGHAYNKLGICAAKLGRTPDAITHFDKAKNYAMSRAEAWFNTGVALAAQGQQAAAAEAYEQAIVNRPAYPSAIAALTRYYGAARDIKNVLRVLRNGAGACPFDVRIHTTLADVLATCSDPALRNGKEALERARHAIALAGGQDHPGLLATLAAALAETGDFAGAKQAATKARQLAEERGNSSLATAIAAQLAGYERGQAYRNPAY